MKRDKECDECDTRVVYLQPWQIEGSALFNVCRSCFAMMKLIYPGQPLKFEEPE